MALLALDIGTTGCKAATFTPDGTPLAAAYGEYYWQTPRPGSAELDAADIWERIKNTIRQVTARREHPPVSTVAVSSLGEAVVPVSADRRILGPSLLNFDARGNEYVAGLGNAFPPQRLYNLTGQLCASHYGLFKLMWLFRNAPELYERTYKFLPWGAFASFMLGAEPVVDYSLASRLLCLDLDRSAWSTEVLAHAGLDPEKLPKPVPAGTPIGTVAPAVAADLGLPPGVTIVAGCHDQCATAIGCGAIAPGTAACSMGTFFCLTPVFAGRKPADRLLRWGLNTEHHGVPGRFVTLVYNQGGALLRWYRDTFAAAEHRAAQTTGRDVYPALLAEAPDGPSDVLVLPHFIATGPPEFISATSGVVAGLRVSTQRGDILKGILDGVVYYLRACVDALPEAGIAIREFRAAGGGSRSDKWLQACADILNRPFARVADSEAGLRGTAVLAGLGAGGVAGRPAFRTAEDGVAAMVRSYRTFEPDPRRVEQYTARYAHYRRLGSTLREYLSNLSSTARSP
ncbi:MAG: FGGY-family carbohydrate kinase [Planctomycetota bacterium]